MFSIKTLSKSGFMSFRKARLVFILLILVVACDSPYESAEVKDLPDAQWSAQTKYSFDFKITDENVPYNFFFDVRHDMSFGFCNLFIVYNIYQKGNKKPAFTKREELELLDCKTGEPLGQGGWLKTYSNNLYDNHFYLLNEQKFPSKGDYVFEVQHYMRPDTIQSVVSVGYTLEKAE